MCARSALGLVAASHARKVSRITFCTTARGTPGYFILPFDVMVPDLFPTEATTDTTNFATWDTGTDGAPAVRFLVPVDVYVPGETDATPPPADYLTYLLGPERGRGVLLRSIRNDGRRDADHTRDSHCRGHVWMARSAAPLRMSRLKTATACKPTSPSGWPSSTRATRPCSPGYVMLAPRNRRWDRGVRGLRGHALDRLLPRLEAGTERGLARGVLLLLS